MQLASQASDQLLRELHALHLPICKGSIYAMLQSAAMTGAYALSAKRIVFGGLLGVGVAYWLHLWACIGKS